MIHTWLALLPGPPLEHFIHPEDLAETMKLVASCPGTPPFRNCSSISRAFDRIPPAERSPGLEGGVVAHEAKLLLVSGGQLGNRDAARGVSSSGWLQELAGGEGHWDT